MSDVPCNGCKLCCRWQFIALYPEKGDDIEKFEHKETITRSGITLHYLKQKPNGECMYLDENGCTIHDRSPFVCREFDCRKQYQKMTRAERRALVASGHMDKRILDAGKERQWSLDEDDWLELAWGEIKAAT